ncbi:MAG TPA: Xaa-Pro peptidase family protein [Mycobacteriales bacterium]|nr:Xaa-Pro peptidase family protein [Mycobacteriales bacterium]
MTSSVDPQVLSGRVAAAADAARAADVDAVLVTPGADLRYLVGYAAIPLERLTCLLVPAAGRPALLVPRLERAAAVASGAADVVPVVAHEETDDAFALAAGVVRDAIGREPRTVAVASAMTALHVLRLRDAMPGARQVLAGPVIGGLRLCKSADEIAALRRAGQAIDRVHSRMGEWLRPGRTEAEVGRDIADAIVAEGHRTVEFVIVASGPNAASPHHDTSERVIEPGDPVVVDIGGMMPDGYCSDCTRTYVAGSDVDPEFAKYYAVLLDAQQKACDAVHPGATAESIDAVARDAITEAGYGEHFIHRTGHGIGLEVHEDPYIVSGNGTVLEPGMCFSIEPGIYVVGRHGARIEDIVVVTDDGGERLNTIDRELVVLG